LRFWLPIIIREIPKRRKIEIIIKNCGIFSTILFVGIDTTE
jgi:hypothetical protein